MVGLWIREGSEEFDDEGVAYEVGHNFLLLPDLMQ
jgi:hypothetical protein